MNLIFLLLFNNIKTTMLLCSCQWGSSKFKTQLRTLHIATQIRKSEVSKIPGPKIHKRPRHTIQYLKTRIQRYCRQG